MARFETRTLKRWWVSFLFQGGEDFRPLTNPPNPSVLGWWCSGEDEHGNPTICVAVDAVTEIAAKRAVCIEWPEANDWRFCEEKPRGWAPSDRFPLTDWMKDRFESEAMN